VKECIEGHGKTSYHIARRAVVFGVIEPAPLEPHYYHQTGSGNPSNSNTTSRGDWLRRPFGKKLLLVKSALRLIYLSHLSQSIMRAVAPVSILRRHRVGQF
jgi:hypothetical protein